MALSALKVWIPNEILFAADLNAEFANLYGSGEDLMTPATKIHDMNGFAIVLDADGDSMIAADVDDKIRLRLSGTDLFRFDGTVTTPVNGWDAIASAAGSNPAIVATGSDTNISIDIRGKGSGGVLIQSAPVPLLAESFSL